MCPSDSPSSTPDEPSGSGDVSSGKQVSTNVVKDLPQLQKARALWARQQLAEALWIFVQTVREHPDHPIALADAARAMGSLYQYKRAERLLERLTQLSPGKPQWLHLAAQSYRLIRRPLAARKLFEDAAALPGAPVDSHLELALLYERQGRWDDARGQIEMRLKRLPSDAEGRLVQARLMARHGERSTAERILRGLTHQKSLFWLTRMRAFFELAAVLEKQAAYDDAWQAASGAKQLAREHAEPARRHRDQVLPPLYQLARACTPDHFRRWRQVTNQRADEHSVLLTGLPRSGTTLLERMLDAHSGIEAVDECDLFPRLIMPLLLGGRPLRAFDVDQLDQLPEAMVTRRRRLYLRRLRSSIGADQRQTLLVDKNPSLLPLLAFYQRALPFSKIVVALRDPRDLLISSWMTFFPLNDFSIDLLDLKTAAQRIASDLELWLQLREKLPDGFVECRYEQLVREPQRTASEVLDLLGLGWQDSQLNYHEMIEKSPVHSPSFERVMQPPDDASLGRWRHYERQISAVLPLVDDVRSRAGYDDSKS